MATKPTHHCCGECHKTLRVFMALIVLVVYGSTLLNQAMSA